MKTGSPSLVKKCKLKEKDILGKLAKIIKLKVRPSTGQDAAR